MLFVFDLDFTLWDCGGTWCDHTTPPYFRQNGHIRDNDGRKIYLYKGVMDVLNILNDRNIEMAVASRTHAPDWANDLMTLFDIKKYFNYFEIYPGSKLSHFQSLQKQSKKPYSNMMFFDDEYRNIQDVSSLGVECIWVQDGLKKEHITNLL